MKNEYIDNYKARSPNSVFAVRLAYPNCSVPLCNFGYTENVVPNCKQKGEKIHRYPKIKISMI